MKKISTLILGVLGFLAFTSFAYAQATGIAATKHNLRSSAPYTAAIAGTADEICVYCHTPHGGKRALEDDTGPLWNRNYSPTSGFDVYASFTLDAAPAAVPTSVSKACLSCHDGTLGINAMINRPGPGANPTNDTDPGWLMGGTGKTNDMALIGKELRDDHPISMVYKEALSYGIGTGTNIGTNSHLAGFRAETNLSGTKWVVSDGTVTLPLYGAGQDAAKVECGTCHDPHEERSKTQGVTNQAVFFLRAVNTGSQLCLTCHLK